MPTQQDIDWLKKLGFPYDNNPELGNLLIDNKALTEELVKATGPNAMDVFKFGLPAAASLVKSSDDLRSLVEIAKAALNAINTTEVFQLGLPVVASLVKSSDDLCSVGLLLNEIYKVAGRDPGCMFQFGLPSAASLVKSIDDLRILVEIAKVAGPNTECVFRYGLPVVVKLGLVESSDDLRSVGLLLAEISKAASPNVFGAFKYGLSAVVKLGLVKSIDDLRILVEIAKVAGPNVIYVFVYGLPEVVKLGLVKSSDDLRSVGLLLADLGLLGGKYAEPFFKNQILLEWYVNERKTDRMPKLSELIIMTNRLKFPGYSDDMYKKMDPCITLTKNVKLSKELLDIAQSGRSDYKKWYEEFNAERIKTMADYGIDVDLWLGKTRFEYKDISISVVNVEQNKIIQEQLPQLKSWLDVLLATINDPKSVLVEIITRLPKHPREASTEAIVAMMQASPKAIPAFIRDVVVKVVKTKPDISCIPEEDLRKLISGFYGKAIGSYKARNEEERAEAMQNELKITNAMSYEQLIENLPSLKVMPYLQTRLKEFTRTSPKPGKEADCIRALHELERIAQAILNLISAEDEKHKTHFEGTYDLRFRVSDKFPTEVLTIGADGHACIQPGGMAEEEGHNFYRDVDALFIEILTTHDCKAPIFRIFKQFERLGFALIFAAVDSQNRPVIALNTVELPKLWPDQVQAKFFDATVDWLKIFAAKAGFCAITIGNGYGSEYFRNKYGEQEVYFKKMSPYPTKTQYYTNAFERGTERKTEEGLVLEYSGKGAIIWQI